MSSFNRSIIEVSITIVLTIFTVTASAQSKYYKNVSVTTGKGRIVSSESGRQLIIPVVLTNNGNKPVVYLSMTCGWKNFYRFSSKMLTWEFKDRIDECTKNHYYFAELAPHEQKRVELKVSFNKDFFGTKVEYKVGFGFTVEEDINHGIPESKIIWSDLFKMKL